MAFSAILRRTASSLAPQAIRALGFQRSHQRLLSSALSRTIVSGEVRRSAVAQTLNFSSKPSSDENLLKVIDYEIKCALEADDHDQVDEVPDGFPFEIEDNAGERTVSLVRDYKGENIKVEVHMPDLVTGEGGDDDDQDDDENANERSSIPLVVNISKSKGPALEFGVTAFPDEITIDSLSIKEPDSDEHIAYEGPEFESLDENLQKAFHKYLEIRGIKPSTTNFLHEYMINKDSREYLKWLENLKNFIAK